MFHTYGSSRLTIYLHVVNSGENSPMSSIDTPRPTGTADEPAADVSTGVTYCYTAFGLAVESAIEIPEFGDSDATGPDAPDVTIRYGEVDHPGANIDDHRGLHVASRDEIYLGLEVGDVVVRNGTEIVVDPAPDVVPELLRWYLVGSVFNHLLHQRGFLILHASTVRVGDEAVCFLGYSTAGKSTTALALAAAGHTVLADDVAAITFDDDTPLVQPGFPALKLDAETRSAITTEMTALPGQCPDLDRHFYRMPSDHPTDPVPLARMYSLSDDDVTAVDPLEAGEALMMLVDDTYTNLEMHGVEGAGENLKQCARIVRSVPVRELRRKYGRDELPAIVDAVLADLGDLADHTEA